MASFEQLTQNLSDMSQPIATRRAAVIEIVEVGGAQALPFLLKALSDVAPSVRREAANALQQSNFSEATPALVDALKKEDSDLTRWTLIEALGNIGTASALSTLESLLSTEISPLTRRESQKSIDLINARHPDIGTAETIEEIDDTFSDLTNTPDFTDPLQLEVEEPELSQETTNESVESEDNPDDLSANSDEKAETSSEFSVIIEEDTPPDDIEAPIIDLTVKQDESSDTTVSEESSDAVVVPQPVETDTQDETNPPTDSASGEKPRTRLVSAPALPVLVPNTSVVIYEQEEQNYKPSTFAMMLRPTVYLSKRWVSRTRLYLVLFCLLVASTIALVYSQVQRRPRSPYLPNAEIVQLDNPEDYLAAGKFFIQQADYRSAIEALEFIRGVDSIEPELFKDLYKNLGFAYFQEKQYALAVEAYEFYLQLRRIQPYQPFVAEAAYPSDGPSKDQQNSSDYKTYNILGIAYKHLGHLYKALRAYEAAIKIAPEEAETYSNLAQLYSDGYQQKHLLAEALAYAAVRLNPDVASHQDTLGWILGKSGRLNKATNVLAQAIRLQSDYVPALYHLTEIAQKSAHPDKTLEVVHKDFIKKTHRKRRSRQDISRMLSYIYETDSQKLARFNASLLRLRGVKR